MDIIQSKNISFHSLLYSLKGDFLRIFFQKELDYKNVLYWKDIEILSSNQINLLLNNILDQIEQ